jgi:hypothetical protein
MLCEEENELDLRRSDALLNDAPGVGPMGVMVIGNKLLPLSPLGVLGVLGREVMLVATPVGK